MNIAFRVDSSIQIGIGHTMRCLSLADQIRKANKIFFIIRLLDGSLEGLIKDRGYKVILLPNIEQKIVKGRIESKPILSNENYWSQDANDTKGVIEDKKLDWLIVDHYGFDYRWHKIINKFTKKLMVIDDLANRKLLCNVLLGFLTGFTLEGS
mgnify:FL=1